MSFGRSLRNFVRGLWVWAVLLSILALSDEEKEEVRAGEPRARAILERTEAMSTDDLMRLHGTWRDA